MPSITPSLSEILLSRSGLRGKIVKPKTLPVLEQPHFPRISWGSCHTYNLKRLLLTGQGSATVCQLLAPQERTARTQPSLHCNADLSIDMSCFTTAGNYALSSNMVKVEAHKLAEYKVNA